MKKKTICSGILCLGMLGALLGGCGSDSSVKQVTAVSQSSVSSASEADASNAASGSTESTSASSAEAVSAEAASDSSAETVSAEAVSASSEAAQDTASSDVTIENQVLFEQDGIRVTATEYVTDTFMGDGIQYLVENDSDQNVVVTTDAVIVNNYMVYDYLYADVAAGKKANEIGYLSTASLKQAGIDTVGQIEVYLRAYNEDTYETIWSSGCITIQTSAFDSMVVPDNSDGTELYNQDGIRIVGKTVDEDSFWGTAILLYVENTSDQNVGISVDDMSINGFMINPAYSSTVYSGKRSLDDITIFDSDLESNGIESIETVELTFHIYNADTFETIADSDPITFSAQ